MVVTTEESECSSAKNMDPRNEKNFANGSSIPKKHEDVQYPGTLTSVTIMSAVLLTLFLVALDRTILATAIPKITDQFHSLSDVGWYGSAYMLTNCSTQLIFGRIYKFYNAKSVLLICIGIFEVGSALCGAAPNSTSFIIGRSIAGLGSAGIFLGGMMAMFHTIPLHKRPLYSGFFGAVFGVASVIAPLLGGAFTDKVTWRWCFYINLPIGAVSLVIILFTLKLPQPKDTNLTLHQQLAQLDPLGTLCFLPAIICLVLALQWGGTTYVWSSWRIILLLTIFSLLLVIFAGIQIWKGDSGTLPPRILFQRSIASGAYFTFCTASSMMLLVYYLPIWFQAVKGTSAFESGIRLIPMVLSLMVAGIASGQVTARIGYYVPAMLISPVLSSIGAGLITTLKQSSGHSEWIGYQVINGFGLGLAMQVTGLAAQAVLPREDVSTGTAVMFFSQQLGGAIFVSVGQNIFIRSLVSGLDNVPGLSVMAIVNTGATDIQRDVPSQYLPQILKAYNHALTRTFIIATIMGALSILGSFTMEWKNIKNMKKSGSLKGEEEDRDKNIGREDSKI
ncbi:major facilitator superfamily domain-containing protein [Xylogone sp. PMI_703]|nr:major facilitator superfamily domain-containing protein [Xylogone sp. PMI_703]